MNYKYVRRKARKFGGKNFLKIYSNVEKKKTKQYDIVCLRLVNTVKFLNNLILSKKQQISKKIENEKKNMKKWKVVIFSCRSYVPVITFVKF